MRSVPWASATEAPSTGSATKQAAIKNFFNRIASLSLHRVRTVSGETAA
jgi:hypothetical protein